MTESQLADAWAPKRPSEEAMEKSEPETERPGRVIALWAPKGGQGVTTIAAGLAVAVGENEGACTLVDYGGDLPAVFGMAMDPGVGIWEWDAQHHDDDLADDVTSGLEIRRLGTSVTTKVWLVPSGSHLPAGRARCVPAAMNGLRANGGTSVVDLGSLHPDDLAHACAAADIAVMVTRPEYVSLRRALRMKAHGLTDAVIVVAEPERSLALRDVVDVLDVSTAVQARWNDALSVTHSAIVSRAVDAGVFAYRAPVGFAVDMRDALKRLNQASEGARMT